MSGWDIELEREEGSERTFWRARLSGSTLVINCGDAGDIGETEDADFASPTLARRQLVALIGMRVGEGYVEVDGAAIDDDEVDDEREPDDEDEGDELGVIAPSIRPPRRV
jgi:predicted DNA-binding WGR domain protein